jgi:hypothetical protein
MKNVLYCIALCSLWLCHPGLFGMAAGAQEIPGKLPAPNPALEASYSEQQQAINKAIIQRYTERLEILVKRNDILKQIEGDITKDAIADAFYGPGRIQSRRNMDRGTRDAMTVSRSDSLNSAWASSTAEMNQLEIKKTALKTDVLKLTGELPAWWEGNERVLVSERREVAQRYAPILKRKRPPRERPAEQPAQSVDEQQARPD